MTQRFAPPRQEDLHFARQSRARDTYSAPDLGPSWRFPLAACVAALVLAALVWAFA